MGCDLLAFSLSFTEKIYPKYQSLYTALAFTISKSMGIHLRVDIGFVAALSFPFEGELPDVQDHAYVPLSKVLCRALSNDRQFRLLCTYRHYCLVQDPILHNRLQFRADFLGC